MLFLVVTLQFRPLSAICKYDKAVLDRGNLRVGFFRVCRREWKGYGHTIFLVSLRQGLEDDGICGFLAIILRLDCECRSRPLADDLVTTGVVRVRVNALDAGFLFPNISIGESNLKCAAVLHL